MNKIVKRVVIFAQVKFTSPLSVSAGEGEWTDSDLLRDGDGRPFVAGSSLAGAMRAYLGRKKSEACLMGYSGKDNDGKMSSLLLTDMILEDAYATGIRDGVALSEKKTALTAGKYELEILEAGAKAHFYMELVIREQDDEEEMLQEIAEILNGIETGEIRIGCKKTRGFGAFRIEFLSSRTFSCDNYLEYRNAYQEAEYRKKGNELEEWQAHNQNKGQMIHIEVPLKMDGGISIRQYAAKKGEPDFVHLTDHGMAVIPGSSFAGAIRHRVKKILNELEQQGIHTPREEAVNIAFGYADKEHSCSSNVIINEAEIHNARPLVMVRTGVSRFESSVKQRTLYKEKTYVEGRFTLQIAVRKGKNPQDEQWILGLVLLAVKDLQNGLLAVGGQTAVGRGIFRADGALLIDGQAGLEEKIIQSTLENIKTVGGEPA